MYKLLFVIIMLALFTRAEYVNYYIPPGQSETYSCTIGNVVNTSLTFSDSNVEVIIYDLMEILTVISDSYTYYSNRTVGQSEVAVMIRNKNIISEFVKVNGHIDCYISKERMKFINDHIQHESVLLTQLQIISLISIMISIGNWIIRNCQNDN